MQHHQAAWTADPWYGPDGGAPADRAPEELDPLGFFDRPVEEEDPWPVDPLVAEAWARGRPRRLAVKACGWLLAAAAAAGVVALGRVPAACAEMTTWATVGQVETPCARAERVLTRAQSARR